MFNINALAGERPIFLLLFCCQWMMFRFLVWRFAVGMDFHQSLIAGISKAANAFINTQVTFFEKTKIMRASFGKSCCYDSQWLFPNYNLRFLGMTLLFTAVMSFLLFFGRSMACSLTSTSNTSISRSLDLSVFLPGR